MRYAMFIQTEATPNPATIKFLPGRAVLPGSSANFASKAEAARSPLALRLFEVPGVVGVFLGQDFISVSKDSGADWGVLKAQVLGAIMEHLSAGQEIMQGGEENAGEAADENPIIREIKELIATRVRPAVMMDGGDIVFQRFEDGIVYLEMRGACAGCPSSTLTLKAGVENMLKHFVPEVREVRQVQGY